MPRKTMLEQSLEEATDENIAAVDAILEDALGGLEELPYADESDDSPQEFLNADANPKTHEFIGPVEGNWHDQCDQCHGFRSLHKDSGAALAALDVCVCEHVGLSHQLAGACLVQDGNGAFCGCEEFRHHEFRTPEQAPLIEDDDVETHQGKPIVARKVAWSGSVPLQMHRSAEEDFWGLLRMGYKGTIRVGFEVFGDGFQKVIKDDAFAGVAEIRKVVITGVALAEPLDQNTDGLPMFRMADANELARLRRFRDACLGTYAEWLEIDERVD